MRVDATTAEPVRSNSFGIEQESMAVPWVTNGQYLAAGVGTSAKLDTFQLNYDTLWASESIPTNQSIVTEFSPGAGALATQNNARLLARGTFPMAHKLVGLSGSVLAINNAPDGSVRVTSVWRRP